MRVFRPDAYLTLDVASLENDAARELLKQMKREIKFEAEVRRNRGEEEVFGKESERMEWMKRRREWKKEQQRKWGPES